MTVWFFARLLDTVLVFAACFLALALFLAAAFFGLELFVADFFRLPVRVLFERVDFLTELVEAFFFFDFFLAGMRASLSLMTRREDLCRMVVAQFESRMLASRWRHPERSRFSGGARDLPFPSLSLREIPQPAGKNAGLRDDFSKNEIELSHYLPGCKD